MTDNDGRWSDEELAALMRRGLAERATRDERAAAGAARSGASATGRRTPRPWLAAAAAAAAAVVGIAVVAPLVGGRDHERTPTAASDTPTTQTANPTKNGLPDGWRWESFDEVSVGVPATWGWGGGPMPGDDFTEGAPIDCGSGAFVVPGGGYEETPKDAAYVGRPVMMTDACMGEVTAHPERVQGDFVLLGSLYELGTDDAGNGFTSQTVEAGARNLTVVTRDPALRKQILATMRINTGVDPNGCRVQPPAQRPTGPKGAEDVEWTGLTLCVYPGEGMGVMGPLLYSARFDADRAKAYADALAAGGSTPPCLVDHPSYLVVLRRTGTLPDGEAATWQDVAALGDCGDTRTAIATSDGDVDLTRATATPWAGDGVLAYVVDEGDLGWTDLFRGILG